jgi:threonine aldolase
VICDKLSHIFLYEGGGVALNALSSIKTLDGNRGLLTAAQIEDAINNPNDIHQPTTRLVSLENTMNKGGGAYYDFEEFRKIKNLCDKNDLPLHLDGARLFNALVETNDVASEYGQVFDSISICLSKGLGCPIGSLLLGNQDFIKKAKRFRKVMGGGWRQAGYLAAAGIHALDHNIQRLKEDHRRARAIGEILAKKSYVEDIFSIDTNIVIFELPKTILATTFVATMAEKGVLCVPFGKHLVRFVTHLDFSDDQLSLLESKL